MKYMITQMLTSFLAAFAVAALLTVGVTTRGMAIWFMWRWFVEPLGVMPIGLAHAIGITAFMAVMTKDLNAKQNSDKDSLVKRIFIIPMTIIAFSWIVHSVMVW